MGTETVPTGIVPERRDLVTGQDTLDEDMNSRREPGERRWCRTGRLAASSACRRWRLGAFANVYDLRAGQRRGDRRRRRFRAALSP